MSEPTTPAIPDAAAARAQGWCEGMALAALAVGLISFLNLLGAEKSILAIVLGTLALASAPPGRGRLRAQIARALGLAHLVTVFVVLVVFREELGELLGLLRTLG